MKPTTLEEALLMVPTHWPLTPGVDVWQDGDEHYFHGGCKWEPIVKGRFRIGSGLLGLIIDSVDIARRPIPQDVRESFARILLNGAEIERTGVQAAFGAYAYNFPFEAWILAGKP